MSHEKLLEAHRKLTSNAYYLTKFQIEFREAWQQEYYLSKENSNAAKERMADDRVPELYMVRKILDATKSVSIAMGYELGIMKNET
jgi:hypothetical protein